MARCKVCSSDLVEQINEKILAGISFVDISEWCKANDFDCSHMSIKRHVDNDHIKQPVQPTTTQPVQPVSQVTIPQDELDHFQQSITDRLKKITILQLRVVETKQIEFIQGISRFPQVEIQALKNIIDMCKSLDLIQDFIIITNDKPKELSPDALKKVRDIYGFS